MSENTKPVICLMGLTGAGKTELAMRIFDNSPVEIISVDSAMIYKGMDIGTAKPSKSELDLYPHHLVDIIDIGQSYSSVQFCQDSRPIGINPQPDATHGRVFHQVDPARTAAPLPD